MGSSFLRVGVCGASLALVLPLHAQDAWEGHVPTALADLAAIRAASEQAAADVAAVKAFQEAADLELERVRWFCSLVAWMVCLGLGYAVWNDMMLKKTFNFGEPMR